MSCQCMTSSSCACEAKMAFFFLDSKGLDSRQEVYFSLQLICSDFCFNIDGI
ncbi:hypothetical protein wTpre_709 [Wolbachia endosymbiont of Trichogramma pretiosum]|nr:hypothetical protein wTpre_709 [Wolbachia endosymbiont of Trichogramma pretiosum]